MAKLYFSYSAMNAGKSTILLQASHNYQERGMKTMLLTADWTGDMAKAALARNRVERRCLVFSNTTDMWRWL